MDLSISKKQLSQIEKIISAYRPYTPIPTKGEWKQYSNNDLWLRHVGQIMVAGSSAGKLKFDRNFDLQNTVNFERLKTLQTDNQINKAINNVLRNCGVRFVGKNSASSMKSNSLLHNFKFFCQYKDGIKSILEDFNKFRGESKELDRVSFLMDNLKFFKNKSARDFLMGVGLNRRTIAIDVRIRNIFAHLKVEFPSVEKLSNRNNYNEIELKIIQLICDPLQIEPVVLDRILYQNYSKILRDDYQVPKLFR